MQIQWFGSVAEAASYFPSLETAKWFIPFYNVPSRVAIIYKLSVSQMTIKGLYPTYPVIIRFPD